MRIEELMGRAVVGAQAQVLGEVCGVTFDERTMKLTAICVKLVTSVLESMGIKKPKLGSVKIDVPVEIVKAIGDVVSLDKSASELGPIVKRL